jgi:peptidoglycan/LPS O-acetylase OafA/YrhL
MYYLGILYYLWQNGYWDTHYRENIEGGLIISNIFFVHGVNPAWINSLVPGGWSISVEMMFYCLVPFLYKKITSLNRAIICMAALILLNLVLQLIFKPFALVSETWQGFLYFFLPNQLPVFLCGIIGYFLVVKKDHSIKILPLTGLIAALIADAIFGYLRKDPLLPGLVFLVLLYMLSHYKIKLLVNTATVGLGKISYSCYLVHFAVLYGLLHIGIIDFVGGNDLFHALLNFSIRLVLVLTVTGLIATIFYRLVELPMQKVGKRLIKYMETTARKEASLPENKKAIPMDAFITGKSI